MVLDQPSPTAVGSLGPFLMGRAHKPQQRPGHRDAGQDTDFPGKGKHQTNPSCPSLPLQSQETDRTHYPLLQKQSLQSCAKTGISQIPASGRFWSPQAKLKQHSFHSAQPVPAPGLKPPCLQTKHSHPPGEPAGEERQPAATASLASRSAVPGSQREDQAHVL